MTVLLGAFLMPPALPVVTDFSGHIDPSVEALFAFLRRSPPPPKLDMICQIQSVCATSARNGTQSNCVGVSDPSRLRLASLGARWPLACGECEAVDRI
mgnify:CR=1 FL=1